MNMANHDYEEQDFDYRFDGERRREPDARRGNFEKVSQKRRAQYSRSSNPPVAYNGIHRRRNKRFAW
jgi:hypothetical protein